MDILIQNKISRSIMFIIHFLFGLKSTNSNILNQMIRLGDKNYRYNHFSFNSEGDLIMDIESFPISDKKYFFGIKKNGREYFTDNSGTKTYFSSMANSVHPGKIEGESCIIQIQSANPEINGKEFLFGVSKSNWGSYRTEISNIKENYEYSYNTNDLFGELTTNVFSIIPDPLNNQTKFNYYISYIGSPDMDQIFNLYTKKIYFTENIDNVNGINRETIVELEAMNQKIVSCFFTDKYLYICFYTNKQLQLSILVINPKNKSQRINYIYTFNENYERRFFKGIQLKGEIGFFAYFKDQGNIPTFSLYEIKDDKGTEVYKSYENIIINKNVFLNNEMLDDLIKLNNNTICFVSPNIFRTGLNILIFSLYNDDNNMSIRHFYINIWEENNIKFYCELRLCLFNNFLLMAFSYCEGEICEENQSDSADHFSSLIFFNYPNIINDMFDVIEYIYPDNKNIQNDINIIFKNHLSIDNNLFRYVYKGIKVISYSNEITLKRNGIIIGNQTNIYDEENIILTFNSDGFYNEGIYNIEFAFIIMEPDYGKDNDYMIYMNDSLGNNIIDYIMKNMNI